MRFARRRKRRQAGNRVLDDEYGRQRRADLDDKHDRVLRDLPGIELYKRFLDRALQDFGIEQRASPNAAGDERRGFILDRRLIFDEGAA